MCTSACLLVVHELEIGENTQCARSDAQKLLEKCFMYGNI